MPVFFSNSSLVFFYDGWPVFFVTVGWYCIGGGSGTGSGSGSLYASRRSKVNPKLLIASSGINIFTSD